MKLKRTIKIKRLKYNNAFRNNICFLLLLFCAISQDILYVCISYQWLSTRQQFMHQLQFYKFILHEVIDFVRAKLCQICHRELTLAESRTSNAYCALLVCELAHHELRITNYIGSRLNECDYNASNLFIFAIY